MDEQDDMPVAGTITGAITGTIGAQLDAEAALRQILGLCCAGIDAHLAVVLDRDDPQGPHKARVWLRRTVTALDAFGPILRRQATAELRAEAKAIFRELGRLRDRDVVIGAFDGAEPSAKLVAATQRLRDKVRGRLRGRDAVLFSPVLQCRLADGTLWRTGPKATALRAGPVGAIARTALEAAWDRCAKRGAGIADLRAPDLHGFRKDLKTLRYLSEFFAPFLIAEGAEPFRAELQKMQDLLGIATDAQIAKALGKKAEALVDRNAVRDAVDRAGAIWQALLLHKPWWRTQAQSAVLH